MRLPLAILGLLAAPAVPALAAQSYDFQLSQDQSQASLLADFTLGLPGTLIGDHDPVDNPGGTRTLPGLFGGSGNLPVDSNFGFLGQTDLDGQPSGAFGMTLDLGAMTVSLNGLDLDLLGGAEGSTELLLHVEFETFRSFAPDSLYLGDFPFDLPLGSQVVRDLRLVQTAASELGVLVGSAGSYTFTALVPAELSFVLVLGEQETPIGPLPMALPLAGSLLVAGGHGTVAMGFDLSESQLIEDPLPGFELIDVPLDLPTVLPPGETAHLLLNAIIADLGLDLQVAVDLLAEGDAPCGFESFCPGNPNSTGQGALLTALGSAAISDNALTFVGQGLPAEQFTYLLMGPGRDEFPFFRGSQGTLCLSMPVLKFTPHVVPTGRAGTMELAVDFDQLPPGVEILAGEAWSFQLWYRDLDPGMTTNTSNAVEVVFCD